MSRGEVVKRVIDGDTFETGSRKHPVRLANVNAPEKGKPGSAKATQELRNLIQGQQVHIDTVARDPYGRAVAKVKVKKLGTVTVFAYCPSPLIGGCP